MLPGFFIAGGREMLLGYFIWEVAMDPSVKAMLYGIGGRFWDYAFSRMTSRVNSRDAQIVQMEKLIASLPADGVLTETPAMAPESQNVPFIEENPSVTQGEDIATACVPCAIGHYAGAGRLLNEAIRFRDDGMGSNQVLDDIAGAIGELNAMERVDLTPERLSRTPSWEKAIAEEALRESRKLRHRLESLDRIEDVERAAVDTESYYKKLNRQWYRERFRHLGTGKAEAISERVAPDEAE